MPQVALVYLGLAVMCVFILFPFVYVVGTSLRSGSAFSMLTYPPTIFPAQPSLENYRRILTELPVAHWYLNSIIMDIGVTAGEVFFCALTGYTFAKRNFPFKNVLFAGTMATLLIPAGLTFFPAYLITRSLGLLDTHAGLILPAGLAPPAEHELFDNLESQRLDLLGLRQGLESQDATVRAAILAQFPKMSVAIIPATDTGNVHTTGFNVTVDVPIFDRNQGVIATERATRQKLLDEYRQRAFEARSDIATAISDIRSLDRQIAAAEEALPLLEKLVESAQAAIEQRNADVLSYYTARSNLLQKRIQLIKLQEQLLEAHTALEIASGRYLPMNGVLQSR